MGGRSPKLSRERISRAAVELVDERGLDALTMRRLGDALDVEAMSLYRHVKNKADLLDAVHEAILTEMRVPPARGGWKTRARAWALAFRDVLVAHPNALPIFATRPAVTPASLAYVEQALAVLEAAPIPKSQVAVAFQTLVAFVVGHTTLAYAPREPSSPMSYGELDAERFPQLVKRADELRERSAAQELEQGLAIILNGLERD